MITWIVVENVIKNSWTIELFKFILGKNAAAALLLLLLSLSLQLYLLLYYHHYHFART